MLVMPRNFSLTGMNTVSAVLAVVPAVAVVAVVARVIFYSFFCAQQCRHPWYSLLVHLGQHFHYWYPEHPLIEHFECDRLLGAAWTANIHMKGSSAHSLPYWSLLPLLTKQGVHACLFSLCKIQHSLQLICLSSMVPSSIQSDNTTISFDTAWFSNLCWETQEKVTSVIFWIVYTICLILHKVRLLWHSKLNIFTAM